MMPILKSINGGGRLKDVMLYADKDNDGMLLSRGVNCSCFADVATRQMEDTKSLYGKGRGREYKHYVLSFATNELSNGNPEDVKKSLDYAEELARRCFGERYQVYAAAHVNSRGVDSEDEGGCLHVHMVVNSVSFVDGRKYQSNPMDLERYKSENDRLSEMYGFVPVDRSRDAVEKRRRRKAYDKNEYQMTKNAGIRSEEGRKVVYKAEAFNAVREVIEKNPGSLTEFKNELYSRGWQVALRGKNMVVTRNDVTYKTGKKISFRVDTLGKAYADDKVNTYEILKLCGHDGYEGYRKIGDSFKRQCADDVLCVISKGLRSYDDFKTGMLARGWSVSCFKGSLRFTRTDESRGNGKPISFTANRLATDFRKPEVSSMIIMQSCRANDYVNYAPRARSSLFPMVRALSGKLASMIRELDARERQTAQRRNRPLVNLGGCIRGRDYEYDM